MNGKVLFALIFGALRFLAAQESSIAEISFSGLKKTKAHFLKRLIKTKEKATYDSIRVRQDVERLKRLPGIASATSVIRHGEDGVYVNYEVVENFTIIPGLRIATANDGSFAYRLSVFEFNLFGNNQLFGGFYEKNVFNSFGVFWEHPFLFSDKLGIGLNYQDLTTQEPIFLEEGDQNYRFNAKRAEGNVLFSFDFKNEAGLGAAFVRERYGFDGQETITGTPMRLEADKLIYRGVYRFVDLDIDYQYNDGFISEFTGEYVQQLKGDAAAQNFLQSFLALRNDIVYYKKVGTRGNWASRARLAVALGNQDSPFAPFVVDNQQNIRGVGNTVDRGVAALVLNTEYRHTLYEKGWFVVQGNAFLDMGSWQEPGANFSQLFDGTTTRLYSGLGFRLIHKKIFNAVFRLDYGVGFGSDASNGIVFGIGQYF